jgi:hypothetical protein
MLLSFFQGGLDRRLKFPFYVNEISAAAAELAAGVC